MQRKQGVNHLRRRRPNLFPQARALVVPSAASTSAAARNGSRLGLGGSPSTRACYSVLWHRLVFHRFLIVLSARPGSSFAISAQRLFMAPHMALTLTRQLDTATQSLDALGILRR